MEDRAEGAASNGGSHAGPPLAIDSPAVEAQRPAASSLATLPRPRGPEGQCDSEWGLDEDEEGEVDASLEAKLAHFHMLKTQGTHFNASLSHNRAFRNPHIYAKLVDWVAVDETASAYPDMVGRTAGGKAEAVHEANKADLVWPASKEARRELLKQGAKGHIAQLQRARHDAMEASKAAGKRSNIDFVQSNPSRRDERSKDRNRSTAGSEKSSRSNTSHWSTRPSWRHR